MLQDSDSNKFWQEVNWESKFQTSFSTWKENITRAIQTLSVLRAKGITETVSGLLIVITYLLSENLNEIHQYIPCFQ